MPLTKKGKKIMSSMKSQYGNKKGEQVFYASRNKDLIKGVEKAKLGKAFGPPPKKGPNSQVPPVKLLEGGETKGERFVKFFGNQFNQNKDKVIKEAVTGLYERDFDSRFKNLMNQAVRDFEAQEGTSPNFDSKFVAYKPTKEETGLTTQETMGMKKGKMVGCPHREMGAKSDIKGISKIQVKGKKFSGIF
jgi:hypothetical protein|tara:strand:- start:967 stop:1536 length:570 start_codon:yes stop_codon:yes gene_type:complete